MKKVHVFAVMTLAILMLASFVAGATYPVTGEIMKDAYMQAEDASKNADVQEVEYSGEDAILFGKYGWIRYNLNDLDIDKSSEYYLWVRQARPEGSDRGFYVYSPTNPHTKISDKGVNTEDNEWEWVRYEIGSDEVFTLNDLGSADWGIVIKGDGQEGDLYADAVLFTEDETYNPNEARVVEVEDAELIVKSNTKFVVQCTADKWTNSLFPFVDAEFDGVEFIDWKLIEGLGEPENTNIYEFEYSMPANAEGKVGYACYIANNLHGTDLTKEVPYPENYIVEDEFTIIKGTVANVIDVYVDDSDLEEGKIMIVGVTDVWTNSVFPFPEELPVEEFLGYRGHEEKADGIHYYWEFKIDEDTEGRYDVTVFLDGSYVNTDLTQVKPYPGTYILTKEVRVDGVEDDDDNDRGTNRVFDDSDRAQWSCTAWSSCYDGVQTRTCTDLNNPMNEYNKPEESRICSETGTSVISLGAEGEKPTWRNVVDVKSVNFWLIVGIVLVLIFVIILALI